MKSTIQPNQILQVEQNYHESTSSTNSKVNILILVFALAAVGLTLFAPIALIRGLFKDTPVSLFSEYPNDYMFFIDLMLGSFLAITAVMGSVERPTGNGYRVSAIIASILFFIAQIATLIIATNTTEDNPIGLWRELTASITIHPVFILTLLLGLTTMVLALTIKSVNAQVEKNDDNPVSIEDTDTHSQAVEENPVIDEDYTIPTFVKMIPLLIFISIVFIFIILIY